ncbi:MAG: flagellar M-ring protein FliF [Alphaproteobacteria bacterium]|nr:flagellar M-ring protein FliF [Alphaproteobacteria bacterium]MCK5556371.1 flagellar M-ring protein FliF [Alphaproteobacteria bacterium]MCK5658612.1 flagellar M-ring protein FliF [Alphaproteobacteria bacterium]
MDALFETLKNLGAGRLAVMLLTFFGLVIFFIFIAVRSNAPGMTLLYGGLSVSDSTEIAAKLDIVKIPYKISEDGSSVTVPQKEVGKARILLAQDGLPHQGTVGYEIFDQKQSFGTTSFVQNINQIRALEGELSRSIGTITSVNSARVHLVLSQRELFSKESRPASASVFLHLRNVTSIGREQIQSIQHLIAAAVPQLKASNVAVIDQNGNLLARGDDDERDNTSARSGEEMKQKYERRVARSIEDMVGRIVGYGRVRATVAAEMNFDVVNRNSESYDPEGQVVRSTQTTSEENVDNAGAGNASAVTVENNLPGLPVASMRSPKNIPASKNNRTEEVTNFEISKTIENLVRASGQVQKISVAVLVDGRYETDASVTPPEDAPEGWQPPRKYIPRDQAEMDKITSLVKSSVGYDEDRGDTLQVVNMQFAEEVLVEKNLKDDGMIMGFQKADLLGVAETVTLSIVAILVILLVLRPLATHIAQTSLRAPRQIGSTLAEETALLSSGRQAQIAPPPESNEESELEAMIDMSQVEGKVKASSVQKISELVTNHPGETVAVIRSWMSQEN